jgi:hypothetical protein
VVTNRVVDYGGFAVRFVGLGYLVLWPLSTWSPFGLARWCRPDALSWRLFCHWPQLIHLTPGLHLIGLFCAGALAVHLALRLAARLRRARAERVERARAANIRVPQALARAPQRSVFAAPLPKIKPRSEFGLRAGPRSRGRSGVSSSASKPKTHVEQN